MHLTHHYPTLLCCAAGMAVMIPACRVAAQTLPEPTLSAPAPRPIPPRGYLGVTLTEICPEVRAQTTLREGEGLMIGRVAEGSPAAQAGLVHYDILTRFNDQWIMSPAQFVTLVENAGPGTEVDITWLRRGAQVRSRVKLAECPPQPVSTDKVPPLPEEMLTSVLRTLRDNPSALKTVYRLLHVSPGEIPSLNADGTLRQGGSRLTLRDDQGTIQLLVIGDSQQLSVWDNDGKLTFQGPCHTREQHEALPESLQARVKRLRSECQNPPTAGAAPGSPAAKAMEPAAGAGK